MSSFSGKQIFLLFGKSTSGKSYRHFDGDKIYLINEETFGFCKEGKIDKLTFVDSNQTLGDDAAKLHVWRPNDIEFSKKVTIAEEIEIGGLQIQLKKVQKELEVI